MLRCRATPRSRRTRPGTEKKTSESPSGRPPSSSSSRPSTTSSVLSAHADIIKGILNNFDLRTPWIEDGIDILLKCICYPNLSKDIQAEYLNLIKLVLEKWKDDPKAPPKYQQNFSSCILILLRNTLFARNRTYIVNLLNLLCRKVPGIDLNPVCQTMSIILEKRSVEEGAGDDQRKQSLEWSSLLNSLCRFMFGMEPDFSCENKNFIGENSKIHNAEVLNTIYEIFPKLDRDNKQKVIQDLIMLFGFDRQNAVITFQKTYFLDWILDIILQLEFDGLSTPTVLDENKGQVDLAYKAVCVFLQTMLLETALDRSIFFKFLATIDKKVLIRMKEIGDNHDLLLRFELRVSQVRSKVFASLLDSVAKERREYKLKHQLNFHSLPVRVIHFIFSNVSLVELDEQAATREFEEVISGMNENTASSLRGSRDRDARSKGSFGEEGGQSTPTADDAAWATDKARATDSENLLDKCYNYERYREFARLGGPDQDWLDEPIFDALRKYLDFYLKYSNMEEFISDANEGKPSAEPELLFRIRSEKNEPKLLSAVLLLLMFAVDYYIEKELQTKLAEVLTTLEKLFINCFALTELERRNLKKYKSKYLDAVLVFILYFLTTRRNLLAEKKAASAAPLLDTLGRLKNKLWRGLLLTLKFDMDKLLTPKEEKSGFSKMISVFKGNPMTKPPLFVDELFFKKYMIADLKKEDFKREIEALYGLENIFPSFAETVQKNLSLRSLVEGCFGSKESTGSEFSLRAETVQEMYKSVAEENNQLKQRKKATTRLRGELEDKMKEMQANLEENFMSSILNAEMVLRECRAMAHSIVTYERDICGMWAWPEIRSHSQVDTVFHPAQADYDKPANKFYVFELNPWYSHKFSRPFLKLRLKQYWKVSSLDREAEDDKTAEMNIFDRGSNKNRKNKKKLMPTKLRRNVKMFTKRILTTAAESASKLLSVKTSTPTSEEHKVLYSRSCELLSRFTIYSGLVIVTKRFIVFCTDNTKSKNYLSILNVELEKHDRVKMQWPLSDIVEIQRRRLVQRKTGVEVFFVGGYSVLLNLPPDENDVQEFHDLLMGLRETFLFSNPFSKIRSTRNQKLLEANRCTERWLAGELSNFHYLMLVNSYAGRSYHDLSQYPVFPWVFMLFKPKPESMSETRQLDELDGLSELELLKEQNLQLLELRNLSKPVGALGTPGRVKTYIEKFHASDNFSEAPNYHYGSHYSSPAIVLHYLIRLSPYTEGAKAIQNGHFDLPDRLFFSINHTFKNAMEEMSDVRELIPEFYSLPELMLNANKLDLGISQTGERVNNVYTPKWAHGNPYFFVYVISKLLESAAITLQLKNWIDLVFGYRQTGEEAEKALNLFYYLTYEDQVDLESIREQDKQGVETQIVHFGQTPSKIFSKPHPGPTSNGSSYSRIRSVNFNEDSIQVYSRKGLQGGLDSSLFTGEFRNYHDYLPCSIVKLFSSSGKRIVCISSGQIVNLLWELNVKPASEQSDEPDDKLPFKLVRSSKQRDVTYDFYTDAAVMKDKDSNISLLTHPTCMLEEARVIVIGGYTSGMVASPHAAARLEPREAHLQRTPQPLRKRLRTQKRQERAVRHQRLHRRHLHRLGSQRLRALPQVVLLRLRVARPRHLHPRRVQGLRGCGRRRQAGHLQHAHQRVLPHALPPRRPAHPPSALFAPALRLGHHVL